MVGLPRDTLVTAGTPTIGVGPWDEGVHMPELKLPDRLRDMDMIGSVSDASKSVSEAVSDRLSKVDLSKMDLPKVDVRTPKLDVKVRDIKPGKARDRALEMIPRRSGPNPVPFLILGVLGGIMVGIWAATSDMFGSQIRSVVDDLENRVETMFPGMGQKARDMQSTVQQTFSSASSRAEQDYARTASGLGSSTTGVPSSTGMTGGEDETVGAGSSGAGTLGSVGTGGDLAGDGTTSDQYGTTSDPYGTTSSSGSSY